jgi:hypothetical protein
MISVTHTSELCLLHISQFEPTNALNFIKITTVLQHTSSYIFRTSMARNQGAQLYKTVTWCFLQKVKVKQSNYNPWQTLRVPGACGSQISRQSAHEGGEVSPTHRPSLPHRKYSWYTFLLQAESTPGPKCGQKNCVNETFQCHHRESNRNTSRVAAENSSLRNIYVADNVV